MKAGESVNDYFGRTLIIANKMRIHGERMEDVVIIEKILRSMTSKYDYVVCSIEESNDLDALSIDELQSSLLVHEQRISRHAVVDEQALQVTYGAQQGGRGTYGAQQEGRGGGRSTYRGRGRGRGRFGHKQAILADLEWEKDEETSTEEESNGEESEVDRNMEENGSNDSESLIEEDASDVNNSPPEGRPRRPPAWMRDYETGQGLSDEEEILSTSPIQRNHSAAMKGECAANRLSSQLSHARRSMVLHKHRETKQALSLPPDGKAHNRQQAHQHQKVFEKWVDFGLGLGDENFIALKGSDVGMVAAVAVFPGEERDEEGGVEHEADSVVEPLVITEGVVATLMGYDPNAGYDTTYEEPVKRPCKVGERVRKEVEVIGGDIV
ncbi:hypothetical protein F0562_017191 [Nyssa sinensis]|uniref:Uncharacterized protein n=1 Tax=Nyssa sinensis TaxID=561372 RepID=A0A5J4ZIF9_9ASTE|nr:hypothetical protein F0562_017191 [Nyssa sinensis]